jgi:predicted DNA-binding transcriptional regulator AlpA
MSSPHCSINSGRCTQGHSDILRPPQGSGHRRAIAGSNRSFLAIWQYNFATSASSCATIGRIPILQKKVVATCGHTGYNPERRSRFSSSKTGSASGPWLPASIKLSPARSSMTESNKQPTPPKYLRMRRLIADYGLSQASIYRWISEGRFPEPIQLGPYSVA